MTNDKTEKILAEIANYRVADAIETVKRLVDEQIASEKRVRLEYGTALVNVSNLAAALRMKLNSDEFAAIITSIIMSGKVRGMSGRDIAGSINVNFEAGRLWKPTDRAGAGTRVKYLEYLAGGR